MRRHLVTKIANGIYPTKNCKIWKGNHKTYLSPIRVLHHLTTREQINVYSFVTVESKLHFEK